MTLRERYDQQHNGNIESGIIAAVLVFLAVIGS